MSCQWRNVRRSSRARLAIISPKKDMGPTIAVATAIYAVTPSRRWFTDLSKLTPRFIACALPSDITSSERMSLNSNPATSTSMHTADIIMEESMFSKLATNDCRVIS